MISPAPRGFLLARIANTELAVHWRWGCALAVSAALLASQVFPMRFPAWPVEQCWLVGLVAVLLMESGLVAHELSHAAVSQARGRPIPRIVLHGFAAQAIPDESLPLASNVDEIGIALAGPGANVVLAGIALALRFVVDPATPAGVVLTLFLLGNVAIAAMSLLPFGETDLCRVLARWPTRR